ncbi:MAG TPA: lysoplasmalogenase [Micromonosporaceae bacterium]|nr:lysoplasmalogenase [Micromonosporaceae bacterium]HCU49371.1 lysoplasmalogenase [Micromonosporaceae bacterium]
MLLLVFGVFALVNLIASGTENEVLEWATKPVLMPLLTLWVWRNGRHKGIAAALLFSAAGDIALLNGDKELWFIAGMVFFLGAHICYIVTFLKAGARVGLAAVGYAVILGAALVWLWKPLGAMAIPMTGYGLALAAMATLAAGLRNWRVALGGGLFLLSDLLIAVRVAEAATIPGPPIWVMLTYLAAQFLIATGWVRYRQPRD